MSTLDSLNFDGETEGATPAMSGAWSIEGNTTNSFEVRAAAAVHGDRGCHLPANTSGYRRIVWTRTPAAGGLVLSFYFVPRTLISGFQYIASVCADTSQSSIGDMRVNSDGTMSIRNGNTAVDTTNFELEKDEVYRIEWFCTPGTGMEARIYAGEATTPLDSIAGALQGSAMGGFKFGMTAAASGFTADYDTIKVADDWTGPEVTEDDPGVPGAVGDPLTYSLNRLAGTLDANGVPTLEAQGAANKWAGTTGLALVGALNVKAGNTLAGGYKELQGVLNQLAGTTGLGVDAAAAAIES